MDRIRSFGRSYLCRERRPETMKIGGERSATSAGCATFSEECVQEDRDKHAEAHSNTKKKIQSRSTYRPFTSGIERIQPDLQTAT
ncbi:MAG TPA: hypothetical protein VJ810_31205 [Blastocatellia bacterium]|nr:hypothetical protein [Blastocatellia bacterium]